MTKSQNTKKEQLTEQWKKGELIGEYWCEITESPYPERVYLPTCDSEIIVKILAPVPSYEELQNMNKAVNECMAANIKLVEQNKQLKKFCEEFNTLNVSKENQRLKELLQECRNRLDTYYSDLLKQIDEVLKCGNIE